MLLKYKELLRKSHYFKDFWLCVTGDVIILGCKQLDPHKGLSLSQNINIYI
jgi:hypothetical protein